MRTRFLAPMFVVVLVAAACGDTAEDAAADPAVTATTQQPATTEAKRTTTTNAATTTTEAPTATTAVATASTTSSPPACAGEGPQTPEDVWSDFIAAFNEANAGALACLIAPDMEWRWTSDLVSVHWDSIGQQGTDDLIARGVTFESEIIGVVGNTLTARTVFEEPGLASVLGGNVLLQMDTVTISDGMIQKWTSMANEVSPADS